MNYLGIDTSAYTTSLAIVDSNKELVWEGRHILNVPLGERGLAQSEAFFQHVQNLPILIDDIPKSLWNDLSGVGVSIAPRPVTGSYMPVFTAGYGTAKAIAVATRIPLISTTHQEGHIAAGLNSAKGFNASEFLAIHLSGGTTEILIVKSRKRGQFEINLIGGTSDLHAGQFVDRIGVLLGLEFPTGKQLELLAQQSNPTAASLLPSSVQGLKVSFSGAETAARRLVEGETSFPDIARAVEGCIARTVTKLILNGIVQTSLANVLLIGGVASNYYIREEIKRRVSSKGNIYWATPDWSRDNAIGVALLTQEQVSGISHTSPK